MTQDTDERSALRTELRKLRSALSPAQQAQASMLVLRNLMKLPEFVRARQIALYIANDGEIDPAAITEQLWKMGKHCYLPVLRPGKSREMWFIGYEPNSVLVTNRFGIPEPDHRNAHKIPPHLLDIVLMPLVGFDRQGSRLGMGGGFYDATFAFKQQKPGGKPHLVGLAHSCQEVGSLANANWDIPVSAIVTEQECILVQK